MIRAALLTNPLLSRMNKLEQSHLDENILPRVQSGEIVWWAFESINLQIAANTHYRPDFAILLAAGSMEFHEVKGFWRDDARAKLKVAAEQYFMFRFLGWQKIPKKSGGGWKVEEFPCVVRTRV